MALVDTLRSAVGTVNSITLSLQADVLHSVYVGQTNTGTYNYGRRVDGVDIISTDPRRNGVAETRKAIVELEAKPREVNGRTMMTFAHLIFLVPFADTEVKPTPDRKNPVDPRDVFILPDGTTGPVVDVKGIVDAGTSAPFFAEVWLGSVTERGTLL